ncbi:F-box/LRR-repeat protein 7, partial [Armadillidium vulgare]
LRSYSSISINLFIFIAYSARFPDSKRLEYYQSYIFLSPLERNLSILTLFSTIDQRISSSQSEI